MNSAEKMLERDKEEDFNALLYFTTLSGVVTSTIAMGSMSLFAASLFYFVDMPSLAKLVTLLVSIVYGFMTAYCAYVSVYRWSRDRFTRAMFVISALDLRRLNVL